MLPWAYVPISCGHALWPLTSLLTGPRCDLTVGKILRKGLSKVLEGSWAVVQSDYVSKPGSEVEFRMVLGSPSCLIMFQGQAILLSSELLPFKSSACRSRCHQSLSVCCPVQPALSGYRSYLSSWKKRKGMKEPLFRNTYCAKFLIVESTVLSSFMSDQNL